MTFGYDVNVTLWQNQYRLAAILDFANMAAPVIAGFGALKKCNQYVLSYICAKFHACRQIWTILPLFLPKLLDY